MSALGEGEAFSVVGISSCVTEKQHGREERSCIDVVLSFRS